MNIFVKISMIIYLLSFVSTRLNSQLTANFSTNTNEGCGFQDIIFTDLSTGGATSWQWDFGNGANSIMQNPVINYSSPGTYTVQLIVSNGSTYDTLTLIDLITIYELPTALFSGDLLSGCVPLTVNFSDLSTPGDAPITSWEWIFGDGGYSLIQDPTYTYTTAGSSAFTVQLNIQDTNSCMATYIIPSYIFVSEIPDIQISSDIQSYCSGDIDIHFYDSSVVVGNIISWLWDFGDGTTSTLQNPIHNYNSLGVFDIILTVENQYGCSNTDTFPAYIQLSEVIASFTITEGDTLCLNQPAQFNNNSGIFCSWDFGDLVLSTLDNPTHAYTSPGNYIVTLIAAPGDACADTTSQLVYVEEVISNFTSSPTTSCMPITVDYVADQYPNIASYVWHFGDGSTATGPTASNLFSAEGNYSDTLIVTSLNGCVQTFVIPDNVIIEFPVANFSATPTKGCAPLEVDFNDLSTSVESITGWQWTFPSGIPASSNLQNPANIIFNTAGEYNVQLEITTSPSGCTDTYIFEIQVGSHQIPDFTVSRDTLCADDTLSFLNLSVDTNLIDTYNWGFSQEFNPSDYFVYDDGVCSDTGFCEVQLITEYNGCYDTLTVDSAIYVYGPIIRSITSDFSCDTPMTWTYTGDIVDAEFWEWDFGDGTVISNSTDNPITYTYTVSGDYWVKLTAENTSHGCDFKDSIQVKIRNQIAALNAPDTVCVGASHVYDAWISQDEAYFYFNFGNGYIINFNGFGAPTNIYTAPGNYTVLLVVRDINGCLDSLYHNVFATQPVAGFFADTLIGCSPFLVNFTDTSFGEIPIQSWNWTFGDGGISNQANIDHLYLNPGLFNVSLTVTDSTGCISTATHFNYIHTIAVYAGFSVFDSTLCKNTSVQFLANTDSSYNYYWDFEEGVASTIIPDPWVFFSDTGLNNIQLIVEHNIYGCRDTLLYTDLIDVRDIVVDLLLLQDSFDCYLATINSSVLQNLTGDIYSPVWEWSFGDGGSSNIQHPAYQYSMPGDYIISLLATLTAPFGCTDADSVFIHLDGPYAELGDIDTVACVGEDVSFYFINDMNVETATWVFGDGGYSNNFTTDYAYLQTASQVYSLNISVSGCNVPPLLGNIQIIDVLSAFSVSDTTDCTPLSIDFINNSIASPLSPLNYDWNFGDGQSSVFYLPGTHTYYNSGTFPQNYNIQLIVNDSIYGCRDTSSISILVNPYPVVTINPDTFICHGEQVNLFATGGIIYLWSPSDYLNNDNISSPVSTPDSNITYYITVTDANNCSSTANVFIQVQQEPNVTYSPDTSIIIGESVPLFIYSDQNNIDYVWAPNYEITCLTCLDPIATPLQTTEYFVVYEDSAGCFSPKVYIVVTVIEEYTLDVPTAFTPDGDGINDAVYVRGWGIKELIEFKIFNRWGQQIFITDDLKQGWDGTYNGKLQNIDTYAYYAKVKLYNNQEMEKSGTINLLR
ncbi:MAG: PKD domain-containing protein [Bacteroidota bacterium]